jgi:restriction system protein
MFFNRKKKLENERKEREVKDANFRFEKALLLLEELIKKHFRALYTKWNQLVIMDEYGNYDFDAFNSEVEYFYENVFLKELHEKKIDISMTPIGVERFSFYFDEKFQKILKMSFEEVETNTAEDVENCSPTEFEYICSQALINCGWTARTTKATGDQGVDVIAEKDDLKLVLQCKKYSTPVGNKAVQEIYAGQQHELADFAAVVTSSTYTKSAKQLASTCGVLLLHVNDLSSINDILFSDSGEAEHHEGDSNYLDNLHYNIDLIEENITECGYTAERVESEGIEVLRAYEDGVPVFHFLISGIGIRISTMNYEVREALNDKDRLFVGLNELNNELNFSKAVADDDGRVATHAFYFGDYDHERFRFFLLAAKHERDAVFLKFEFEED